MQCSGIVLELKQKRINQHPMLNKQTAKLIPIAVLSETVQHIQDNACQVLIWLNLCQLSKALLGPWWVSGFLGLDVLENIEFKAARTAFVCQFCCTGCMTHCDTCCHIYDI